MPASRYLTTGATTFSRPGSGHLTVHYYIRNEKKKPMQYKQLKFYPFPYAFSFLQSLSFSFLVHWGTQRHTSTADLKKSAKKLGQRKLTSTANLSRKIQKSHTWISINYFIH